MAKKQTCKLIIRNKGANRWIKLRLLYSRRRWALLVGSLYARFENNRAKLVAVLAQQYRLRAVLAFEGILMKRLRRQFNARLGDRMKDYVSQFIGI